MMETQSEKDIAINASKLSKLYNNAPQESEDYAVEAQVLDTQVKSVGVNNIAVVAPYGAGKSSAIATYLKRYRKEGFRQPKHIQISLADFNAEDGKPVVQPSADKENAIEQSVLQQLLYSQKKHKLPNSDIHRTNKSRPLVICWYTALAVLFLLSLIVLICEISGNALWEGLTFIKPTAVCVLVVTLAMLIMCFMRTGKLRHIKYKELEIGIDKNEKRADYSLINKYIDEVLYFFECINVDLVIFEDLDRFDTLKIFVKLRELNTIINNSPKKAKKVTFIYAVRDDMFANETQRAKFFEFILPVIPVINPNTTADTIREINKEISETDSTLSLSDQFIKDIAYFVSDMRVLKNAFNDYIIMSNKLSDNSEKQFSLKHENLFALVLYKNLYPYDYSRLLKGEGLIPLCVDKERVVKYFIKDLQDKIKEKEEQKTRIDKETLESFEELKLIFKGQHYYLDYCGGNASNVDSIETFENITKLAHPKYVGYSGYSVLLQKLPTGESYYEREKAVKGKAERQTLRLDEEIRQLSKEVDEIENRSFHDLIAKMGIENYFTQENVQAIFDRYKKDISEKIIEGDYSETQPEQVEKFKAGQQFGLIRMMLLRNYIDEFYLEYISNYKSELNVADREFISNVKKGYCKSYNYRLHDVRRVIQELTEEDFSQPSVIINDICKSLGVIQQVDSEQNIVTHKYESLMRLFSMGKEAVVKAVFAFLSVAEQEDKTIFARHIVEKATSFIEELFRFAVSDIDKDLFAAELIRKNKSISGMPTVKSYIEEHSHYTSLMNAVNSEQICDFICNGKLIFKKLDVSLGKDSVFTYIVENDHYTMNVDNTKIILEIDERNVEQFEKENYSYIQKCENTYLKKRVSDDLNAYFENVFMILPPSKESEDAIADLLNNENIDEKNKSNIITHTDFKITDLKRLDVRFYEQLLTECKVLSTWSNIVVAYKALGYEKPLIDFITNVQGKIAGSFYDDVDQDLHIELFNHILDSVFEEDVMREIAENIDMELGIDMTYGKHKGIGAFILAGCFKFNVNDMQYLSNPPSTIPYLVYHQEKIKESMQEFFASINYFKALTLKNILEDARLSLSFKKEFLFLYGGSCEIMDIEELVAEFIIRNSCKIKGSLLSKFTNVTLKPSEKMSLISLAIENIRDLAGFKTYFCAIDEAYAKFWTECKKVAIENTISNRLVAEFMKDNGLIKSFKTRNDHIHLTCA